MLTGVNTKTFVIRNQNLKQNYTLVLTALNYWVWDNEDGAGAFELKSHRRYDIVNFINYRFLSLCVRAHRLYVGLVHVLTVAWVMGIGTVFREKRCELPIIVAMKLRLKTIDFSALLFVLSTIFHSVIMKIIAIILVTYTKNDPSDER